MIFVNRRNRNSIYNNISNINKKSTNVYIPIEQRVAALSSENISNKDNIIISKGEKIKEMLWGEPTWFFFHTIAEKIKEEYFNELRLELFNFVKLICANLPCPDCAKHATSYMNKINFDNIVNKEQLKILFFKFHNEVNSKKKYELFDFSDLDDKYSNAITINIIKNFYYHYSKKNFNVRMDTSNYQRMVLLKQLRSWLEKHYYCFNE